MTTDYDWVKQQLGKARVTQTSGDAVLKLLEYWDTLSIPEAAHKETLETFRELALSHALVPEADEEVWVQAQPGFVQKGDEVRILPNAFEGEAGKIHNGRRGKVVAVRYGDIIVRSTDGLEPFLDGTHYPPYKLQKRVK
jgi:hypothetical protein